MENLVNDMMDLAKAENNTFKLDNKYFDLGFLIHEAFQIILHSANQKEIELRAYIDNINNLNDIRYFHGDRRRMLQILLNFLSNSLKFTQDKGKIIVVICVRDLSQSEKDNIIDRRMNRSNSISRPMTHLEE